MENKLREEIKEIINKLKQKHYVMSAHFEGVRDFEVALAEELETLINKHYVRKDEIEAYTDKEELPDLSKIKPKMIDVEETVRLAEEIRKEQGDTDKEGASR